MNTDRIFVIGHVNPDTDSIASAVGYAWLLRERDGLDAVPARAGTINPQTSWVLNFTGIETPVLIPDASPKFESVTRRLDTTTPDQPLRDAWAISSRTGGIAPVINSDGSPFGLITGRSLFMYLTKLVGPQKIKQDMPLSELLDLPSKHAADTSVPCFQASWRIRDMLNRILREEGDDYLVVDENKHYIGVCRQRDLLNPPRMKIVLVDHNEPQQALGSLHEADLLEILDHHRLGNSQTHIPIRFTVDVVGSTSTLVSERIEDAGLSAPPAVAALLLAGLLSDTLIFTSPTTSDRDRQAGVRLSRWAFSAGSPFSGETLETYGHKVLTAGTGLRTRPASEVVLTDMKMYTSEPFHFAISQAEVSDMVEVSDHVGELQKALEDLQAARGLDFAVLMVTDVVGGSSRLLTANPPPDLGGLPYKPMSDGSWFAEGIVSRKKQLLPVILGMLER
jgi:manganese-dependent inorganic pyrophosphatase